MRTVTGRLAAHVVAALVTHWAVTASAQSGYAGASPDAGAAAADDAEVLRALRGTMLNLEQVLAAAAVDSHYNDMQKAHMAPACCVSPVHLPSCAGIKCPLKGWATQMDAAPCSWAGVSCGRSGRVEALEISSSVDGWIAVAGLRLAGRFPHLVGQLTALHTFVLDVYTGVSEVSAEFDQPTQLPDAWADLRLLRRLHLERVGFIGGLPSVWAQAGALPQLEHLQMILCGLAGSIPDTWAAPGALPSLRELRLVSNALSGTLPARLPAPLQTLALSRNNLTGPLPDTWASTALAIIDLHDNTLTGTLPSSYADSMPNLEQLILTANRLPGTLPPQWHRLAHLSTLELASNTLSSSVPPEWVQMREMQYLNLHSNSLSGAVPAELGCISRMPSLNFLSLANNRLSGSLPGACAMRNTSCSDPPASNIQTNLRLANNSFTGQLPEQLPCSFGSLVEVDASHNQLTGTVPSSWWTGGNGFSTMQYLYLQHNRLQGTLPPSLFSLLPTAMRHLKDMDLSHNHFTGPLPATSGSNTPSHVNFNEPPLQHLDLSGNRFLGTLPVSWATEPTLSLVKSLNLSGNLLEGTVPSAWFADTAWPFINSIDISGNIIGGALRVSLAFRSLSTRSNAGDILRPFDLVVLPGNPRLCHASSPSAGIKSSQTLAACVLHSDSVAGRAFGANRTADSLACRADASNGAGPALPACKGAASAAGPWYWTRFLLFGTFGVAAAITAAATAARRRAGSRAGAGAGAGAATDAHEEHDEERQLLVSHHSKSSGAGSSSSGSGPGEAPVGLHRELRRRLLAELSSVDRAQQQRQVRRSGAGDVELAPRAALAAGAPWSGISCGASGSPLDSVRAAIASGTLQLRFEDLDFARPPDEQGGGRSNLVVLGSGGQAEVYLASLYNMLPVAVKVVLLPKGAMRASVWRQVQQEVALLHRCRHPGVLQLMGVCEAGGLVLLVTELMRGGSLRSKLGSPELAFYARGRELLLQVATGLLHLHRMSVVHMDLNSNNVLLSADLSCAKISDAGLAGRLKGSKVTAHGGTLVYAAPEQLLGHRVDWRADVFALGVVMYEVVTGKRLSRRARDRQPRVPEECPPQIVEVIEACTTDNPVLRPTLEHVISVLAADPQYEPL